MKFYTVEEVAKMLKVKPKTVRLWLQKGKLQGIKIGRLWRISEQQLNEFIEKGSKRTPDKETSE